MHKGIWFVIVISSISSSAGLSCYQGWVRERDSCYKACLTSLPWQLASDDCQSLQADLVTVSGLAEQTRILELRPEDLDQLFWIGYHKEGPVWRWPGRRNSTFSQLDTQNKSFTGDCAAIDKKGAWLAVPCDSKLPFFCETGAIDCPQDDGWFEEESKCMLIVNASKSWSEARGNCRASNSELVVLSGRVSHTNLKQGLGTNRNAWVGITLDSREGKYKWLDGSDVIETPTNTQNASSLCGAIKVNATGQIQVNTMTCTTKLMSVCEKTIFKVSLPTSVLNGTTKWTATSATGSLSTTSDSTAVNSWFHRVLECVYSPSSSSADDCVHDVLESSDTLCGDTIDGLNMHNYTLQPEDTKKLMQAVVIYTEALLGEYTPSTKCKQDITETLGRLHTITSMFLQATTSGRNVQLGHNNKVYFIAESVTVHGLANYEIAMPGCLASNISTHVNLRKNDTVLLTAMLVMLAPYRVMFADSNVYNDYYAVSPIFSLTGEFKDSQLNLSHIFTMFHPQKQDMLNRLKKNTTSVQDVCGFYDITQRLWSSQGCEVIRSDLYTTTCACNHTTSFAVLMKVTNYKLPRGHEVALSVITSIGCSISMLTMFIALTIFTCIRSLNSERVYVHRNLCLAILCAQVAFLAGIKATEHKMVCRIAAILLHYCYTAVFTWMFVEGLHLYTKVVQVFGTENTRTTYYLCFGWGIPLLLVTISAVADIEGYGSPSSCWLSIYRKTIWAFVGPAVAVITVNACILVMVLKIVISSTKMDQPSHGDQVRAGVKGAAVLLPLLGMTWLFGLLAINKDTIVFEYMFALCNSLQGFFVFLFHCLLNSEVRESLKRVREQRALRNGVSMTSSFTDSIDGDSNQPTGTIHLKAGVKLYLPFNAAQEDRLSKELESVIAPGFRAIHRTNSGTVTLSTKMSRGGNTRDDMTLVYM